MKPLPLVFPDEILPFVDAFAVTIIGVYAATRPAFHQEMEPYSEVPFDRSHGEPATMNLKFYLRKIAQENLASGQSPLSAEIVRSAAQMLAIATYDTLINLPDFKKKSKNPVMQFFRHVRNGSAHGNKFHFENDEPRSSAQWDLKNITKQMHGNQVFFGLLSAGDLFYLINDVNKLRNA